MPLQDWATKAESELTAQNRTLPYGMSAIVES